MNDKINVSKGDAKWYASWKNRIENNKPREGDYNFILFKGKDGVVYEPPVDGSDPAIFENGRWNKIVTD